MFGIAPEVTGDAPHLIGRSPVKGLSVEFVQDPNPCCFETAATWRRQISGQRTVCAACANTLKTVECDDAITTVERDSLGFPKVTLEKGYVFQTLCYDRGRFDVRKFEQDLEDRELRKDGITDSPRAWMAVQAPASWLDPETVRLVVLAPGLQAVAGKLRPEFVGKQAPASELTVEASREFGIQRR